VSQRCASSCVSGVRLYTRERSRGHTLRADLGGCAAQHSPGGLQRGARRWCGRPPHRRRNANTAPRLNVPQNCAPTTLLLKDADTAGHSQDHRAAAAALLLCVAATVLIAAIGRAPYGNLAAPVSLHHTAGRPLTRFACSQRYLIERRITQRALVCRSGWTRCRRCRRSGRTATRTRSVSDGDHKQATATLPGKPGCRSSITTSRSGRCGSVPPCGFAW